MAPSAQIGGGNDRPEFAQRPLKFIVDHDIVERLVTGELVARGPHAQFNGLRRVVLSPKQASPQGRIIRRQYENADAVRLPCRDLPRALPVDLQDKAFAGCECLPDPLARGAVVMAKHPGIFQKAALPGQRLEFGLIHKMIGHAIDLVRPRRAGGVRDGDGDVVPPLKQRPDQRGLAGPGRRGNDKQRSGFVHGSVNGSGFGRYKTR